MCAVLGEICRSVNHSENIVVVPQTSDDTLLVCWLGQQCDVLWHKLAMQPITGTKQEYLQGLCPPYRISESTHTTSLTIISRLSLFYTVVDLGSPCSGTLTRKCVCPCTCLTVAPPVCLTVCLSVCLSPCLSVRQCVCPSVTRFNHV